MGALAASDPCSRSGWYPCSAFTPRSSCRSSRGCWRAVAIVYAIRQAKLPKVTERKKLRFHIRPGPEGPLGRVVAGRG
jgi:hypothetical protein